MYLPDAPVARVDWSVEAPPGGGGGLGGGEEEPPGEPIVSKIPYFYHTDHLGTPIAMTSMAGSLVWRAEHLPFGGIWSLSTSTVTNNLRFPGQYFDSETGLAQNWFRDYSARTGRYLESDPIGLAGGTNPYVYTQNSPLNLSDPTGLYCMYSQSSGRMTCYPVSLPELPGHETLRPYYDEFGYAGTGDGRNNPELQEVPFVGPLPRGPWSVGPTYDSDVTGRNTMMLTPLLGNECFETKRECATFRMHGNDEENDASEGCIVLPPNRTRIPRGETVFVVR